MKLVNQNEQDLNGLCVRIIYYTLQSNEYRLKNYSNSSAYEINSFLESVRKKKTPKRKINFPLLNTSNISLRHTQSSN